MNLNEIFPSLPFMVRNYKHLCVLLGEPADAYSGSGRNGHLSYLRHFLTFHAVVTPEGKKTHRIEITEILNPAYVKWIPHRRQWAYDASLLINHYLTISVAGDGPNPHSADMKTFVATTSNLCSLLGFSNANTGRWRRGNLPIDLETEDQISQFNRFYKFISNTIGSIAASQMLLSQFSMTRAWIVQTESATAVLWRLASEEEKQSIEKLSRALLKTFGAESFAHLFLIHKNEEFFDELNAQITKVFPYVIQAWKVWHIGEGHELEELSFDDKNELQEALNASSIRWAIGAGIDNEIIEAAIAKKILG